MAREAKMSLQHAKDRLWETLRDLPGICGIGIGADCLHVYVETRRAGRQVPEEIEGIRVVCTVTGKIRAA